MGKAIARHRVKGGKGKRWKKGQSSSSNPLLNSFREAAKNRFFSPATGKSNLTLGAIAKHNIDNVDKAMDEGEEEDFSAVDRKTSAKTDNTWASGITNCTNVTFGRVHQFSDANSAVHKEILAVLAAITEVIKMRGGTESETEYFAALMTALESVEGDDSLNAVMYLLALVVKRLPNSVVRSKFTEISNVFVEILEKYSASESPAILRSTIVCLASVLRMQDLTSWTYSYTKKVYDVLLRFIVHSKPRVRRATHKAVRAILYGSDFMLNPHKPDYHPMAAHTSVYCNNLLERDVSEQSSVSCLYVLSLLTEIMGILPQQSLKISCETILKLLTLGDVMITSVAMKTLHGMFTANPDEKSLPADLNARLITALYDYQPNISDTQPLKAWLIVLENALVHLCKMNISLGENHMMKLVEICMSCMLSEKLDTIRVASKTIKVIIRDCIKEHIDGISNSCVNRMFAELNKGLTYQYHSSWLFVLQCLSDYIQAMEPQHYEYTVECLRSLSELRASDSFPFQHEVDHAIGQAVKRFGPRNVLDAVPLQITGIDDDYNFPRGWLLPVLRDHISNTELAYFTAYFLPLAARLRANALKFSQVGQTLEATTYGTLYLQVWSLLPGFCTQPTDLKIAFKSIAKVMGTVITEQEDLRQEVMSSLRKLVVFSLTEDHLKLEMARFSKNFLPLFLNLFTSEEIGEKAKIRLAVLETIKVYLKVCDNKIIATFFGKCQQSLQDDKLSSFKRHALLDIILPMIAYLNTDDLQVVFNIAITNIKSRDKTKEKKCYRLLEELFSVPQNQESDDNAELQDMHSSNQQLINYRMNHIRDNIDKLMEFFTSTLGMSSASAKAPRIRCLISIFKQIDTQQFDFLSSVLPEIVLCTKEEGESARKGSFEALTAMSEIMMKWSGNSDQQKQDAITELFTMLLAGLAGNPHMISCSLLSITSVAFKFKEHVSDKLLDTLVSTLTIILKSASREVTQSALSLLKCLFTVFTDIRISPYLTRLVKSVIEMKTDCQKYLRLKIKEMFVKWTKKYGYELIAGMVPLSHQKMLKNIKKTQERVERRKAETEDLDEQEDEDSIHNRLMNSKPETIGDILRDTDSEIEDDTGSVGTARTAYTSQTTRTARTNRSTRSTRDRIAAEKKEKSQAKPMKGSAWLKDGSNIVDFLDPSVASNVMASKPKSKDTNSDGCPDSNRGFELAPNGKLIIREEKTDNNKYKPKQKNISDEEDELEEIMNSMGMKDKSSRKRKFKDDYKDSMSDMASNNEYKTGGGGIHRDLKKTRHAFKGGISKKDAAEVYRSKKAAGDVKKIGKHDPYAYIPLDYSSLNKRKQAKQSGKFNSLIKGARKGSRQGKVLNKKIARK